MFDKGICTTVIYTSLQKQKGPWRVDLSGAQKIIETHVPAFVTKLDGSTIPDIRSWPGLLIQEKHSENAW